MLKNVLHVAGSGSAFNTLANAILILAVKGIQTVCSPLVFTVYDVPHCRSMKHSGGTVNFNTQNVEKIVTYPLALTEEPFIIVAMSNSQYYPSWFAVEISRTIDFTLIPQGQAGWTGYFILGK